MGFLQTPTTLTSTSVVRKWIFFRVTQVRSVYLQRAQYFEARTKTTTNPTEKMLRLAASVLRIRPIAVFAVCAALALTLAIEGMGHETVHDSAAVHRQAVDSGVLDGE